MFRAAATRRFLHVAVVLGMTSVCGICASRYFAWLVAEDAIRRHAGCPPVSWGVVLGGAVGILLALAWACIWQARHPARMIRLLVALAVGLVFARLLGINQALTLGFRGQ